MIKILLISQNTFNHKAVEKLSEELGFDLLFAFSPNEALEIIDREPLDFIVSSMYFENTSCEALLKSLSEGIHKDIPVVVLSSIDDPEMRTSLYALGIVDFIPYENFIDSLRIYVRKFEMLQNLNRGMAERTFAILDDDALETAYMEKILRKLGAREIDVYHEPEALLESGKQYQIYLVDMVLPNMSGERVTIKLRHENPFSVIIAISSIDNQTVICNELDAGADDYLVKPIEDSNFSARIKANLRTAMLLEELKLKNDELLRLTKIDALTGLYNRKYTFERLEEEQYRASRYGNALSVVMIDIDHFKEINDCYGHLVGDRVLREIGALLKGNVRKSDIAGRFGGEEFVLILPNTGAKEGHLLAENLRSIIEKTHFNSSNISVTASFGIASGEGDPLEMIRMADNMLYKAKANGRNCVES